jgi:hypothetical protein
MQRVRWQLSFTLTGACCVCVLSGCPPPQLCHVQGASPRRWSRRCATMIRRTLEPP